MKRSLLCTMLSITVLVTIFSMPVFAEMVKWQGMIVDSKDVPQAQVSTEAQSGTDLATAPAPGLNWGTSEGIVYTIGPADFVRRDGCSANGTPNLTNLEGISPAVGQTSICVGAPVHLPTGAFVYAIRIAYYDNSTVSNPAMGLFRFPNYGPITSILTLTPSEWSAGDRYVDFYPYITIDNAATTEGYLGQPYFVLAILDRNDASTYEKIYSITFWYTLQISPAPATATFSDVPTTHQYFQYIEALADSGITTGYADGTYRPGSYVTRGQMAVFLSKALGLHWPY